MEVEKNKAIYYADPMCPWCWGFSIILSEIMQDRARLYDFEYVAGGLRTGDHVKPVTEEAKEYVKDHWECAMLESGQDFRLEVVDEMDYRYDTEPACRAVVTVRKMHPGHTFDFEKSLQEAFYTEGLNPTRMETYLEVLHRLQLDQAGFEETYHSRDIDLALQEDFARTARLERKILPTLIVQTQVGIHAIARGFTAKKHVIEKLQEIENSSTENEDSIADVVPDDEDHSCDITADEPC